MLQNTDIKKCVNVLDIYYKNNIYDSSNGICLNILNNELWEEFFSSKSSRDILKSNIVKYVRFTDHNLDIPFKHGSSWKFENIVKILSQLEDIFGTNIHSIDIDIRDNKRLFYDLVDFYGHDLSVNVINNKKYSPFEIIKAMFLTENNSYFNGISLDSNITNNIWFHSEIWSSIDTFINSYFKTSRKNNVVEFLYYIK